MEGCLWSMWGAHSGRCDRLAAPQWLHLQRLLFSSSLTLHACSCHLFPGQVPSKESVWGGPGLPPPEPAHVRLGECNGVEADGDAEGEMSAPK